MDIKDAPDQARYLTILGGIISEAIFNKVDMRINVSPQGHVSFVRVNAKGQRQFSANNYRPHIELPIFNYLMHFLSIFKYNMLLVPYKLLTEQEKLILDRVRSGKYKEIKIRFNRRNSILLELTEERKLDNAAKLEEILVKGAYQDLHLKTDKGEITYSTITTKQQI